MNIAKLRLNTKMGIFTLDAKLLAAAFISLPDGTKLVGTEKYDMGITLLFQHPLFREGAEIIPSFQRDVAIVDGEIIEVDHFVGLNLSECLLKHFKEHDETA